MFSLYWKQYSLHQRGVVHSCGINAVVLSVEGIDGHTVLAAVVSAVHLLEM